MTTKKTAGLSATATVSSVYTDDMFASDTVIERAVKLGDGKERTLYFKELTAIEIKQHLEAERSEDPKVRNEAAARLIAKSLVEPDGRRAMTAQKAAQLKPAVSSAIFWAIMEMNGVMPQPAAASDADKDDDDQVDEEIAGEDDESGN